MEVIADMVVAAATAALSRGEKRERETERHRATQETIQGKSYGCGFML